MKRLRFGAVGVGCALLVGCQAMQPGQAADTGPSQFADVAVVSQLQLDSALYGHNMAVSGCMAYATMQNGFTLSKLAVANLCGSGTAYAGKPVLVGETAASYAVMNGITASGSYLYVTYGWVTNPFEVWSVGGGTVLPAPIRCIPLFSDVGYTSCGPTSSGTATSMIPTNGSGGAVGAFTPSGYGALFGENPYVLGNYAYVAENSDDAGQAVQVVNVLVPTVPVKVNPVPLGVSGGTSTGGAILAGIWAAGSGNVLYVGTVDSQPATDQPVTIAAYDLGTNPVNPPRLGVLNVPVGYAVQAMSVTGTTVVATLYAASKSTWQVMVANFANPANPTYATVAATAGCGFESQDFVALQGSYAFIGCGMGTGIEVVKFSPLTVPAVVGEIGTTLTSVGFISPQGRYLYALDMSGNLDTIDAGSVFQ